MKGTIDNLSPTGLGIFLVIMAASVVAAERGIELALSGNTVAFTDFLSNYVEFFTYALIVLTVVVSIGSWFKE